MKNEVSSLELRHLVVELQALVGTRIDKVYQPGPRTFLFSIRKTGEEKRLVRIELPKYLYFTALKEEMPDKLSGFCGLLRKYVEGKAITAVEQVGMERIVKISLSTREESLSMYLEFYGKGNFIVCEADNNIIGCLEPIVFKDRVVKPGAFYEVPERSSPERLELETFTTLLEESKQENVSTALAVDLGIGGLIANELCALAGIAPGKQASVAEIEKLYVAWQTILKRKPAPVLVIKNEKPDEALPFLMKQFETAKTVSLKSISEGLDKLFLAHHEQKPKPTKDKQTAKLVTIITMQEQNANKLETQAAEEQKKGEFIYENYQEVKAILDELQVQMKHHSLQELQEKFKGHKNVKEIRPKDGAVVLEF